MWKALQGLALGIRHCQLDQVLEVVQGRVEAVIVVTSGETCWWLKKNLDRADRNVVEIELWFLHGIVDA